MRPAVSTDTSKESYFVCWSSIIFCFQCSNDVNIFREVHTSEKRPRPISFNPEHCLFSNIPVPEFAYGMLEWTRIHRYITAFNKLKIASTSICCDRKMNDAIWVFMTSSVSLYSHEWRQPCLRTLRESEIRPIRAWVGCLLFYTHTQFFFKWIFLMSPLAFWKNPTNPSRNRTTTPSVSTPNQNHPPTIIKPLPKNTSRRISDISSSKEIFDKAAPYYKNALKAREYEKFIEFNLCNNDRDASGKKKESKALSGSTLRIAGTYKQT